MERNSKDAGEIAGASVPPRARQLSSVCRSTRGSVSRQTSEFLTAELREGFCASLKFRRQALGSRAE